MGKKPQRPTFSVTIKGYMRGRVGRRNVLEHVYVWENANGPVPRGYEIHHINENKQDNRLENLRLVTRTEHKRLHGGCTLVDGVWYKPCGVCGGVFPITSEHFYFSPEGWPLYGRCRRCHIAIVVVGKRLRRLQKRSAENVASDSKT